MDGSGSWEAGEAPARLTASEDQARTCACRPREAGWVSEPTAVEQEESRCIDAGYRRSLS